ncbi:Rid family detoxifying hydrolase [Flavobacterium sp. CS20]|uniref:Rid family detoxifying hydrolase n=1 Tax=Flavobacterium sp. CS20 TaxID=2775246 RepID=UPI001B3A3A65|nr:Rid family detoxifying hydrolase [Flavobacterium sp. CS20]QTY27721.1 Rid family detoxifying hydrolase [Flavobacterium sp. CS20]
MTKQIINSNHAPKPIYPYNQSVKFGNLLFTSGQIALDLDGNLVQDSIEIETHQVFKNLKAILHKANLNFEHVIKVSIFLKEMSDFEVVNSVYSQYFKPENAPARETVQVAKLPKDVNIEISLIAGTD